MATTSSLGSRAASIAPCGILPGSGDLPDPPCCERKGPTAEAAPIFALRVLLGLSILLGGGTYDAAVLAPNLRGGPGGLEHGRLFLSRSAPAHLFRVAQPATQLLLLAAAVTAWRSRPCGRLLAGAGLAILLADVITFRVHYPRNRRLFTAPLDEDPERWRSRPGRVPWPTSSASAWCSPAGF